MQKLLLMFGRLLAAENSENRQQKQRLFNGISVNACFTVVGIEFNGHLRRHSCFFVKILHVDVEQPLD